MSGASTAALETASATDHGQGGDLPDWELAFRFASGGLCLAFCATVGERWRRNFERLRSPADLGRWFVVAGLLDRAPDVGPALLADARTLREATYRSVRSAMEHQPLDPDDRSLLNLWGARDDLAPQLDEEGSRRLNAGRHPAVSALASVARDAIELLSGPEMARVRECSAPDCALLFVDRSRPGRRRWCSDGACGTRSRSSSYRRRHARTAHAPDTSR